MSWQTYGGFTLAGTCLPCCEEEPGCFLTLPPPGGDPPYTDEAEAAAVLASAAVSNCVGFADIENYNVTSFTATDGGTTLTLAADSVQQLITPFGGLPAGLHLWGGVEVGEGDSLSIAYALATDGTLGDLQAFVDIYTADGTFVETLTGTAGVLTDTLTSSPLSAGCYAVYCRTNTNTDVGEYINGSFVNSSDGTLAVGTVRAAYGGTPDYLICT